MSLEQILATLTSLIEGSKKEWISIQKTQVFQQSEKLEIDFRFIVVGQCLVKLKEATFANLMELSGNTVPLIKVLDKTYKKYNVLQSDHETKVKLAQKYFSNPLEINKIIETAKNPKIFDDMQAYFLAKTENENGN